MSYKQRINKFDSLSAVLPMKYIYSKAISYFVNIMIRDTFERSLTRILDPWPSDAPEFCPDNCQAKGRHLRRLSSSQPSSSTLQGDSYASTCQWLKPCQSPSCAPAGGKRMRNTVQTYRNKSNRVWTTDAFWRSARILVSESSFKRQSFMFPVLFFCSLPHFSEIQFMCDEPTDGPTDKPSYRDARTHLKITNKQATNIACELASRAKEKKKDRLTDRQIGRWK